MKDISLRNFASIKDFSYQSFYGGNINNWFVILQPHIGLDSIVLAFRLSQDKFLDEMERIITSRKKVSIKKDQGWYSESEMKSDLKWGPFLG